MVDQTNPYTQMGMMGMMMPNPYTAYKGQPLPMPGYMGTPTDAQGNPIQSFTDAQAAHDAWTPPPAAAQTPGTTLNSSPLSGNVNPSSIAGINAARGLTTPGYTGNQVTNADKGSFGGWTPAYAGGGQAPQTQQPAAATPQNPIDMRQAYLTALSNPGKVTTPGATVPQAPPLGQPSVLNSFLAAHPGGGGTGAGNYSNTGFFDTLNKLRSA